MTTAQKRQDLLDALELAEALRPFAFNRAEPMDEAEKSFDAAWKEARLQAGDAAQAWLAAQTPRT